MILVLGQSGTIFSFSGIINNRLLHTEQNSCVLYRPSISDPTKTSVLTNKRPAQRHGLTRRLG
eukprot:SAG11_NODE_1969_length_3985_cov_2.930777_4_plen_63_part_00